MQFRRLLSCGLFSTIVALTACSGGGGSSSSPGAGGSGGGSTIGTQSIDTQRSLSGSALSVAGSSVDYNQLSGPQSATVLGIQDATTIAASATAGGTLIPGPTPVGNGTCFNGVEFTYSSTSGTITEKIEQFYDAACTKPYRLENLTITPSPRGAAGAGSSSGTVQVFDQSGNTVDYQTFSQTFTVNANGLVTKISQTRTDAASATSPPTSQYGSTCLVGPLATTAIDCGTGNALTDTTANEALGFVQTTTGQFLLTPVASPAPTAVPLATAGAPIYRGNPSSLSLTINGSGYTGAIGALTLSAGTAPAWTIAGGTKVVTLSGTATIGFGFSSVMSSVDLTLVDSADGLTATLTSLRGPGLTGTVTNSSGATVATIAIDLSGTGKITYSNGTTEQVKDWIILG
jgi:hypothetical protein